MYQLDGMMRYSATDLLAWLGCEHASRLDAEAVTDRVLSDWIRAQRAQAKADLDAGRAYPDPLTTRGDEHEALLLTSLRDSGVQVVSIPKAGPTGLDAAVAATTAAMRSGEQVVYQAALSDGPWFGFADFLIRVDGTSELLGEWLYEVHDTKLAKDATSNALLQMAHYGAMVEKVQGAPPPRLVVRLGGGESFAWEYEDAAPYLFEVRERFLAFQNSTVKTEANPVPSCSLCRWSVKCDDVWGVNDLRHVHRLSGPERLSLRESGLRTVADLAFAPVATKPLEMHAKTFLRLQAQALVQAGNADFGLVRPQDADAGVAATPARHELDMYLDLEGDPFAATPPMSTLDYLWAYCDSDGRYFRRWAHTEAEERDSVQWLLGEIARREDIGGDWRVYHYNTYEQTAIKRVLKHWPVGESPPMTCEEADELFERRFDDLYRRVELGVRTRHGSTSLKIVEKIAGYDRGTADPDDDLHDFDDLDGPDAAHAVSAVGRADDSIKAYEAYLRATDDVQRAELLRGIRRYNTHDVRATKQAHEWLLVCAATLAPGDLTHADVDVYEPSVAVRERIAKTEALQSRLVAAADAAQSAAAALPSELSPGGARMLAAMLGWHRSEAVVSYTEFLRLKKWAGEGGVTIGLPEGDDTDDSDPSEVGAEPRVWRGSEANSCLLDVTGPIDVDRAPEKKGASKTMMRRTYKCRPGAWKVKPGTVMEEVLPAGSARKSIAVTIVESDPVGGTFAFDRQEEPSGLGSLVVRSFNDGPITWESLTRVGEAALVASEDSVCALALRVLDRTPPLPAVEMAPVPGEDAQARGLRLAGSMREGLLPVQGPPGTGKTTLAADLVLQELATAKSENRVPAIGVVANSHKVISNLLKDIQKAAKKAGVDVDIAHLGPADKVDTSTGIKRLPVAGKDLHKEIAKRSKPMVVGAVKFGWCDPQSAGVLDLLIIDEAGQMSLADALAVVQASPRVVALGDPQQLAAPVQAKHDDTVLVSLLEHVTRKAAVMPSNVGVFLEKTYRMHPEVCKVVSHLAYADTLEAATVAKRRDISGPTLLIAGHTVPIRPGIVWLPVDGDEDKQAQTVVELTEGLLASTTVTTEEYPDPVELTGGEILVVAPHNAHVNRIAAALKGAASVGTVDKFQGQQAHVVIFAMGHEAQSSRDVRFVYDLNRLNVALSRARLMVVVVAQSDACFPPVNSPEDLLLASRFATALRSRRAEPTSAPSPLQN